MKRFISALLISTALIKAPQMYASQDLQSVVTDVKVQSAILLDANALAMHDLILPNMRLYCDESNPCSNLLVYLFPSRARDGLRAYHGTDRLDLRNNLSAAAAKVILDSFNGDITSQETALKVTEILARQAFDKIRKDSTNEMKVFFKSGVKKEVFDIHRTAWMQDSWDEGTKAIMALGVYKRIVDLQNMLRGSLALENQAQSLYQPGFTAMTWRAFMHHKFDGENIVAMYPQYTKDEYEAEKARWLETNERSNLLADPATMVKLYVAAKKYDSTLPSAVTPKQTQYQGTTYSNCGEASLQSAFNCFVFGQNIDILPPSLREFFDKHDLSARDNDATRLAWSNLVSNLPHVQYRSGPADAPHNCEIDEGWSNMLSAFDALMGFEPLSSNSLRTDRMVNFFSTQDKKWDWYVDEREIVPPYNFAKVKFTLNGKDAFEWEARPSHFGVSVLNDENNLVVVPDLNGESPTLQPYMVTLANQSEIDYSKLSDAQFAMWAYSCNLKNTDLVQKLFVAAAVRSNLELYHLAHSWLVNSGVDLNDRAVSSNLISRLSNPLPSIRLEEAQIFYQDLRSSFLSNREEFIDYMKYQKDFVLTMNFYAELQEIARDEKLSMEDFEYMFISGVQKSFKDGALPLVQRFVRQILPLISKSSSTNLLERFPESVRNYLLIDCIANLEDPAIFLENYEIIATKLAQENNLPSLKNFVENILPRVTGLDISKVFKSTSRLLKHYSHSEQINKYLLVDCIDAIKNPNQFLKLYREILEGFVENNDLSSLKNFVENILPKISELNISNVPYMKDWNSAPSIEILNYLLFTPGHQFTAEFLQELVRNLTSFFKVDDPYVERVLCSHHFDRAAIFNREGGAWDNILGNLIAYSYQIHNQPWFIKFIKERWDNEELGLEYGDFSLVNSGYLSSDVRESFIGKILLSDLVSKDWLYTTDKRGSRLKAAFSTLKYSGNIALFIHSKGITPEEVKAFNIFNEFEYKNFVAQYQAEGGTALTPSLNPQ